MTSKPKVPKAKIPKQPKQPMTPEERQQLSNERAIAGLYGNDGANAGNALINKFLPNGVLGRVSTELDPTQQEAISKMQAGLGGYSSGEYQAQREQMQQGVNSQYATADQQLARAQARNKVFGAAASAQNANLITATQNNKNDLEQKLMVQDIDERQKRLTDYAGVAANQDQQRLERQKVNLGQSDAETAAQIGLYTGAGATAIQKAQTRAAQDISRKGIAALK